MFSYPLARCKLWVECVRNASLLQVQVEAVVGAGWDEALVEQATKVALTCVAYLLTPRTASCRCAEGTG
jgi:hypothetical protein